MNFNVHNNSAKDDLMDAVLCKKHLDALTSKRPAYVAQCTVTETTFSCEECFQVGYEAHISEG